MYGDLVMKHHGSWQTGYRKGQGTLQCVYKLKKWILDHKASAIALFIDIKKAFDSIKNLAWSPEAIYFYKALITDLKIVYNSNVFNYDLPQGSLLSPFLFNLIFDIVLKTAQGKVGF